MKKYFFQPLHFKHDENLADWNFSRMEETSTAYVGVWDVVCSCGAVKARKRAFPKPDAVSVKLQKYYSLEKDGDKYYTMCGFTYEAAMEAAKKPTSDNYHV